MEDLYIRLGQFMKKWRLEAGLSQAEVAEKLGITQTTYGKYELGQRRASVDMLFAIEQLYKDLDILHAVRECQNDTGNIEEQSEADN